MIKMNLSSFKFVFSRLSLFNDFAEIDFATTLAKSSLRIEF